jgi:hypothetical protein
MGTAKSARVLCITLLYLAHGMLLGSSGSVFLIRLSSL